MLLATDGGVGNAQVAQAQSQRLCAASALDELAQLQLNDVEADIEEVRRQFTAQLSREDRPPDVQGAARHVGSVVL